MVSQASADFGSTHRGLRVLDLDNPLSVALLRIYKAMVRIYRLLPGCLRAYLLMDDDGIIWKQMWKAPRAGRDKSSAPLAGLGPPAIADGSADTDGDDGADNRSEGGWLRGRCAMSMYDHR